MKHLILASLILLSVTAEAQFRRYLSIPPSPNNTPSTYAAIPSSDLPDLSSLYVPITLMGDVAINGAFKFGTPLMGSTVTEFNGVAITSRIFNSSGVNGFLADATGIKIQPGGTYNTGASFYKKSDGYIGVVNPGNNGDVYTLSGGLPTWTAPTGGTWGTITGTLSAQTDLQSALDSKQNSYSNFHVVTSWSDFSTYISGLGSGVNVNVWFPQGVYSATSTVTISNKANVQIFGEGAFIQNLNASVADVIVVNTASTLKVKGLKFLAQSSTQAEIMLNISAVSGSVDITECEFRNLGALSTIGIQITTSPNNAILPGFVIDNCRFINTTSSGTFDYNSNNSKGTAIKIVAGSEYWKITNCSFNSLQVPIWIGNGANGLILGNTFTDNMPYNSPTKYGIVYMEDNATNTGKLDITANKFNHNWGYSIYSVATTLDFPTFNINNNQFITNNASSIVLPNILSGSKITENIFRTSYVTSGVSNSPFGTTTEHAYMQLANSSNDITNNEFWTGTNSQPAIVTTGSSNNNQIRNNWVQSTFGTFTSLVGASDIVYDNDSFVRTAALGGTGNSTYTKGDLLQATGTSALGKLAVGANNTVLIADNTQTTGSRWATLGVGSGGTGTTSGFATSSLIFSNGTSLVQTGTGTTSTGTYWDASSTFLDTRRGTITTNAVGTVSRITQLITNGSQMTDGFGPALVGAARDVDGVDNVTGSINWQRQGADNSYLAAISTTNAGVATTHFNISSSGNVSVGNSTTLGSAKLHVRGAGTTTGGLLRLEDNAGTARMTMTDEGTATLQGPSISIGNGTSAPSLRLLEPSGSGTNYTALTVGAQSADINLTLPTVAPGGADYSMVSNASGTMSWKNLTSGGSSGHVQFNNGGGGFSGSSNFSSDAGGNTYSVSLTGDNITVTGKAGVGGSFMDSYTDSNNSGTSETDLYTYTTPGNFLSANHQKITFKYTGTVSDITSTAQFKVLFDGQQIVDTGAITVSATGVWVVEGYLLRTGTTTARASVTITMPFLAFATASLQSQTTITDLTSLDFTDTSILKITGQAGGAGGGSSDITGKQALGIWYPGN